MKQGAKHLIKGELLFYVNPDIGKDMKPVNPSKRDLLPWGFTRQECDISLNRIKKECAVASDELKTRNENEGVHSHQLDAPAGVIVFYENVMVAYRYGDVVSLYRDEDLAAKVSNYCPHLNLADIPLEWRDSSHTDISLVNREHTISIPQAYCTSSNSNHLFVGNLSPSLIRMQLDPLCIEQEYPLNPILHTKIPNRHPWLQDMKAVDEFVFCLFTGSPSPLQVFSLE
ncbi:hypothetical protein LOD99_7741 [Oopsacas minuta]|uniref:Uncharacterized protein n=1 Tax=Oopsacas minuta TaxID=111878 RepID=A0AAV7JQR0_9METZ|nr:hypothetical protein LOD99_7741 [Oopsacas minuta]